MPIYEYVCSRCEQKFELLKSMSQAGKAVPCPSCGGKAERVLSRFCRCSEDSLDFPYSTGGSACSSCWSINTLILPGFDHRVAGLSCDIIHKIANTYIVIIIINLYTQTE